MALTARHPHPLCLCRPPLKLREMVPWTTQFGVLLERSFKEQMRQRGVHITQLLQTIVMAVLVGTVFLQIGTTESSVVRRQPLLFFCVVNQVGIGQLPGSWRP